MDARSNVMRRPGMPDVDAVLLSAHAQARGDVDRPAIHDEDGGPSHRALMVVLVPLMLVLFIATLDQTIVATTIPSIADHLGDRSSASWIATAYLLTSAVT